MVRKTRRASGQSVSVNGLGFCKENREKLTSFIILHKKSDVIKIKGECMQKDSSREKWVNTNVHREIELI